MVNCIFRVPKFPLLCDVGSVLVGALSLADFSAHVAALDLPPDADLVVIDASAEGWVFHTKRQVLSPLTFKKRWTKQEVITLFNGSDVARKLERQYSERSLSAKRFDRIMREIVALIRSADQTAADIDAGASNPHR